jgi:hypothetical protein
MPRSTPRVKRTLHHDFATLEAQAPSAAKGDGQLETHLASASDGIGLKCARCGEEHELLEIAFGLPDDYSLVPPGEQAARGMATDDLCMLDSRCFIRGVLPLPVWGEGREYCFGVWAEVTPDALRRCIEVYSGASRARNRRSLGGWRMGSRHTSRPSDCRLACN